MKTRMTERITQAIAPRKPIERRPDSVFWQSLIAINQRYFDEVLLDYVQTGRSESHIYNKFSTVSCWLDVAIEEGWIDEKQSQE